VNYSELALISSSKTCVISRIFRIAHRCGVALLVSDIPNTPLYVVRQRRQVCVCVYVCICVYIYIYIYIVLELDDQGIEHPSRTALGATHPPLQWEPSLFPGEVRAGRDVHKPPHLVPRLKKEWSYDYCIFWPSWPIPG
jgi:hypothetical protein